jgi:hypothetical protein
MRVTLAVNQGYIKRFPKRQPVRTTPKPRRQEWSCVKTYFRSTAALPLGFFLMLGVSAIAQSPQKPAKLQISTVPCEDGQGLCFQTALGSTKKISELKVSDLPKSGNDPLSLETTIRCQTLGLLATDNEQKKGAVAEMVPQDVLSATPNAAILCLSRDLMLLSNDAVRDDLIGQVAAMLDATAEMHRREYNRIAEKYNALLMVAKDLQDQLLTTRIEAAQQQRINNALTIYSLMPKYPTPQSVNINIVDCTRRPALCVQ